MKNTLDEAAKGGVRRPRSKPHRPRGVIIKSSQRKRKAMELCYITDRKQAPEGVLRVIERALRAGVDLVQIREKDLSAGDLLRLTRASVALAREAGGRILVNSRADVAMAGGADGIHLPSGSPSPAEFRRASPAGFVIGVSCHSIAEIRAAAAGGADFAVFGPVFDTPSKRGFGPPQDLAKLREACQSSALPVYALGGVSQANAGECFAAGAAGVAGISLFQRSRDLEAAVAALRKP